MFKGYQYVAILLLSVTVLGGVSTWAYWKGFSSGSISVQRSWDKERSVLLAAAMKVEQDNRKKEEAHRTVTLALESSLKEAEAQYEETIAVLRSDYAKRLQSSDERAARYRGWSEASSGERDRLADHATNLDRSLTEGRELVKEFRVALGKCERNLKALGEQITMDRDLIGN
jgi:hypothetical protein